jgi:hypothetical protein
MTLADGSFIVEREPRPRSLQKHFLLASEIYLNRPLIQDGYGFAIGGRQVNGSLKMKRSSTRESSCRMRPRPIFALPPGVNLSDMDFVPSKEEREAGRVRKQAARRLKNLANLMKLWQRQDDEYEQRRDAIRQKHINTILALAEQDRAWLERVNEIQQEQKRVTDYWLAEQKKTADAIHKAQLKRLAQINEDIKKSAARAERQELLRRGVVRGIHRPSRHGISFRFNCCSVSSRY